MEPFSEPETFLKNIDLGFRGKQSIGFNLAVSGGGFEAHFWIAITPEKHRFGVPRRAEQSLQPSRCGWCFEAPFWIALPPKSTSIWCSETKAKAKISLPCFSASKSMFFRGDSGFENESIAILSTRFFRHFFGAPDRGPVGVIRVPKMASKMVVSKAYRRRR